MRQQITIELCKTEKRRLHEMKKMKKVGGFSLIEVLISLVILAVGLLAIAQLQVHSIRGINFSKHMTQATQLGNKHLELLRSIKFDNNPATVPTLNGVLLVDENNRHYLCDNSTGACNSTSEADGAPSTWHYFEDLIDPSGEYLRNPVGTPERSRAQYFVRWTIERGGFFDGTPPTNCAPVSDCVGVPPNGHMSIVVEVIWWENPKEQEAAAPGRQVNNPEQGFGAFHANGGHHVIIRGERSQFL
jgi:prepilin-type N-terminal cleavage/methylation domain-containing protein